MMNLTILPTRGAKLEFEPKRATNEGFEAEAAGAKGLAPPGPEPPPKPIEEALREDGATREPIAPTQNLDFSPRIDPKKLGLETEELALDLKAALAAEFPEDSELPIPLPKEYAQGFSLAAVAVLGPIVVPAEQAVTSEDAKPVLSAETRSADVLADRNRPLQLAPGEHEFLPTDDKHPSRLMADVCPVNDPPVRPGKDPSVENPPRRSREIIPDSPLSQNVAETADVAPARMPTREERMAKIATMETPLDPAPRVEVKPTEAPVKIDLQREAAIKLKLADQPKESIDSNGHPIPAEPAVAASAQAAKVKAKADETERSEPMRTDAGSEKTAPIRNVKKGSEESGDALLKRGKNESELEMPEIRTSSGKSIETSPNPIPTGSTNSARLSNPVRGSETAGLELAATQREAVIRQVIDRVESLAAANPRQNVTIHLDPKDFGSITLIVKRSGAEVDTEIYASNEAVRHALEINKAGLHSGLELRGVHLASMTVGSELPNGSGRQEQAAKEAAQTPHFQPRSEANAAPNLSIEAIRSMARRATGVDLWI